MTTTDHTKTGLDEKLSYLKLSYMCENYELLAKKAAQKQWTHVNYLAELATAEANLRADRATKRRIRAARFAQIKTLEQFKWSWPKKINQLQVKNLFSAASRRGSRCAATNQLQFRSVTTAVGRASRGHCRRFGAC